MSIETHCNGCGKLLRVGDEHAGKQARCPGCGAIYEVPASSAPGVSSPVAPSSPTVVGTSLVATESLQWYMKTPEGQIYGPVSREQLSEWAGQGRISADCFLRQGDRAPWQTADAVFPTLRAPRTRATSASTGGGYAARPQGQYAAQHSPYRPSAPVSAYGTQRGYGATTYQQPHRGPLVLTFALLGWFLCPIFSVVAWSMGSEDLSKMRLGQMDPSGQGLTQAGQVLGMIQSIIFLVVLVLSLFMCLIGAASGA